MATDNPYPRVLTDETSGIKVADLRHFIWAEGYEAAVLDGRTDESQVENHGK